MLPSAPPTERRACPRFRQHVRVVIVDPSDVLDQPYAGWIVDRSKGGIRLSLSCSEIPVGSLLIVQPAASTARLPCPAVRVKNRRRKEDRIELGCEFVADVPREETLFWGYRG
jgi:hypothetical protein